MQSKQEPPQTPIASAAPEPAYYPYANFLISATLTSAAVVLVTGPFRTIIFNLTQSGIALPAYTGGLFGVVRSLYPNLQVACAENFVRSSYLQAAKTIKPIESIEGTKEEISNTKFAKIPTLHVSAMAAGDCAVTQIPELHAFMKRLGLNYTFHKNLRPLSTSGFGLKFGASMFSFWALLQLETDLAKKIPVQNEQLKHLYSGMASGAFSAVCTYPLATLRDNVLKRATVVNGELIIPSTTSVLVELVQGAKQNPKEALTAAFKTLKTLPPRAVSAGAVFATVAVVNSVLGNTPYSDAVHKYEDHVTKNPHTFFGTFFGKSTKPSEDPKQTPPASPKH